ncbi:hypothetical protein PYCCODRAFT_1163845 [Trametes coccinea BRFM310]|uniref:Uncharacterized protein n=1 Tax=Trametes coccinea (strain BRFM310) TaxID=1353009 RepID=A0A1Y2IWX5_TRAC3|nr:hypothetical protein PYCCODRAFT_1163845 [Trametes coccinea BRFM310]
MFSCVPHGVHTLSDKHRYNLQAPLLAMSATTIATPGHHYAFILTASTPTVVGYGRSTAQCSSFVDECTVLGNGTNSATVIGHLQEISNHRLQSSPFIEPNMVLIAPALPCPAYTYQELDLRPVHNPTGCSMVVSPVLDCPRPYFAHLDSPQSHPHIDRDVSDQSSAASTRRVDGASPLKALPGSPRTACKDPPDYVLAVLFSLVQHLGHQCLSIDSFATYAAPGDGDRFVSFRHPSLSDNALNPSPTDFRNIVPNFDSFRSVSLTDRPVSLMSSPPVLR